MGIVTWCRRQKLGVHRVRVGDVEIEGLVDLSLFDPSPGGSIGNPGPTAPSDIRRQFGGEALDRLHRQQGDGPDGSLQIVEEDD